MPLALRCVCKYLTGSVCRYFTISVLDASTDLKKENGNLLGVNDSSRKTHTCPERRWFCAFPFYFIVKEELSNL